MVFIDTSAIVDDRAQHDGRRHIRERHTETDGTVHDFCWMAESGQNASDSLAGSAAYLEDALPEEEVERVVATVEGGKALPDMKYSVPLQRLRGLRRRLRDARGPAAGRIAARILTHPDGALETVFDMTPAEVVDLKIRLTTRANAAATSDALEGE